MHARTDGRGLMKAEITGALNDSKRDPSKVTVGALITPPEQLTSAEKEETDLTIKIWRDVLDGYKDAYDQARDDWKSLDTKAQGTVAIAGIFISGIISIFRQLSSDVLDFNHLLLGFSILNSGVAVALAAATLWIRRSRIPPAGVEARSLADRAIGSGQPVHPLETERAFVQEQITGWDASVQSIRAEYTKKASRLLYSQILLLAVVAPVVIVLLKVLLIDW